MPRKYELTWQSGSGGRNGRWKKIYKGTFYYFAYGTSKSDVEGYRQALEAWRRKKEEIDKEEAQKPKPHQQEYEHAIDEWNLVLQWARERGDDETANRARQKLDALQANFAKSSPPPLAWGDGVLDIGMPPDLIQSVADKIAMLPGVSVEPELKLRRPPPPAEERHDYLLDGHPWRVERKIWEDRLEGQRRKSENQPNTVQACIDSFLNSKRAQVNASNLTAGRYEVLRVHLDHFSKWLGSGLPVSSITGKVVADYHAELFKGISEQKWSVDYAQNRLSAIRTFIRWLWHVEAIEQLPRILESKELRIGKKLATPAVFSLQELKGLLSAATSRTKLYLLLMLNCGMTQKDISDLKHSEVDWEKGTIKRKRYKTAEHENVPVVAYQLWPETFRLLQQERSIDPDLVLVNQDGGPLKVEELGPGGRLRKIDNIRSAFNRLARANKIKKQLKLLRKTSATLLRGNRQYSGLENLFLGHSPRTISDQHYSQVPQELFDEAIGWLGKRLGIVQSTIGE